MFQYYTIWPLSNSNIPKYTKTKINISLTFSVVFIFHVDLGFQQIFKIKSERRDFYNTDTGRKFITYSKSLLRERKTNGVGKTAVSAFVPKLMDDSKIEQEC